MAENGAPPVDMAGLMTYLDRKFDSLNEQNAREAKKATLQLPDIKSKGNLAQYKFCANVAEDVAKVKSAILDQHSDDALGKLDKLQAVVDNRIKLIKLADKSPSGWETVNQYIADDLASDSEDDKKMRKAEKDAARTLKERKQKRLKTTNAGGGGGPDQVLPLGGPFVTPPLPKAPLQGYPDAAKKEDTASAVGNKDIGQKPALLVPEVLPNPQLNRVQNTVVDKISDFAVLNDVFTDLGFGESIDFNDYVPTKLIPLRGSLLKALPFWREIESSQFILQTIELGYTLPFLSIPNSCFLTNNRSAKDNSVFVESAIVELLVDNLVEEVFSP